MKRGVVEVLLWFLIACKSASSTPVASADASLADASVEADDASATACAFARPCPLDRCRVISGYELDEDAGCMRAADLGCQEFGGSTTNNRCFRRLADGELVTAPGSDLVQRPEFAPCTEEEAARVRISPCE